MTRVSRSLVGRPHGPCVNGPWAGPYMLVFALLVAGCGLNKNEGDSQDTLQGIPLRSSQWAGLSFTATNVAQSFSNSRLYYYAFDTGLVTEQLAGESANPAVFWQGGQLFHFNRRAERRDFRAFDPRAGADAVVPEATSLSGLAAGDPWDVIPLVSGKSLLLAAPFGGGLLSLDLATGSTAPATEADFAAGSGSRGLQIMGLLREGTTIFALHRGVDDRQSQADGTQQMFQLQVQLDGSLIPADQDPTTDAVDGIPLSSSNPTGFVRPLAPKPLIAGLCTPSIAGCVQAADRLDPVTRQVTSLAQWEADDWSFWNQIVAGPNDSTVYAHVKSNSEEIFKVIKLNLDTGTVVDEIHEFPDARLYGIQYDPSSRILFVGGISADGLRGTMTLYKDDNKIGTFEMNGVPYNSVLVPKNSG